MKQANIILRTIRCIQDDLHKILEADGCREGWVQGEFYKRGFKVNSFSYGKGRKADLLFNNGRSVAEIKIHRNDHAPKCINGFSNVSRFIPKRKNGRIFINKLLFNKKESSIFKDCSRLKSVKYKKDKLFILIIDNRGETSDFGMALRAIKLSRNEKTYPLNNILIRIWSF